MMLRLDHVQLAIPPGAEDLCRGFYIDALAMEEIVKPPILAARGGLWLRSGDVQIHLGVEEDFHPARKAHPAIRVSDLNALALILTQSGCNPIWDDAIPNMKRFYASDPVGNRLEFIAEN